MNFQAEFFPAWALWTAWAAAAVLLFFCRVPRLHETAVQKRWAAALILLTLLWTIHAGLSGGAQAGMSFHLLGGALVLLMLGFAHAVWLTAFCMLLYHAVFYGWGNLPAAGINFLAAVLPALVFCRILLAAARRFLPHHLFVFIFVNAFFAGWASMMIAGACAMLILDMAGAYSAEILWQRSFPVFLLLSWGEAFFSGLLCAVFIAFAPQFLAEYSDEMYLPARKSLLSEE